MYSPCGDPPVTLKMWYKRKIIKPLFDIGFEFNLQRSRYKIFIEFLETLSEKYNYKTLWKLGEGENYIIA